MSSPRPIDVRHLGRERVICCFEQDDVLMALLRLDTAGRLLAEELAGPPS